MSANQVEQTSGYFWVASAQVNAPHTAGRRGASCPASERGGRNWV
jgi:hypothetical protein